MTVIKNPKVPLHKSLPNLCTKCDVECGDYCHKCGDVKRSKITTVPTDWKGFELTEDDFDISLSGVVLSYNSHVIKYIMKIQTEAKQLQKIKHMLSDRQYYLRTNKHDLIADIEEIIGERMGRDA